MRSDPQLAETFRALHGPDAGILVCPAAWDAASARLFQDCGARAMVTSSLGIAHTLGYADGETFLSMEENLRMLQRIVEVVSIPVSGDMEAGYGDPEGTVEAFIEAGVVAVNLEDRVGDEPEPRSLEESASRVAAVREAVERLGFPLFLNARTDAMRLGSNIDDAVQRLNAYMEAGADGAMVIVPDQAKTPETIRELVQRVHGPLTVPARSGRPDIRELEALGVRRVSVGISGAMLGFSEKVAKQLLEEGTFELMDAQKPLPALNETFRNLALSRR